jgi:ketosteroid isomerase-like protein
MLRTSLPATLTLSLTLAACANPEPPATPPVDPAAVEVEVAAAMTAFREAMLANDVDAVVGAYTEDAALSEPDMNVSGEELRATLRQIMSTATIEAFEARAMERFVHGDVVYERGEYDEAGTMGGQPFSVQGFYFIRWEKGADGVWRMDRLNAGPRSLAAPPAM